MKKKTKYIFEIKVLGFVLSNDQFKSGHPPLDQDKGQSFNQ